MKYITYLESKALSRDLTKDCEFIGESDGLLQSLGVATAIQQKNKDTTSIDRVLFNNKL